MAENISLELFSNSNTAVPDGLQCLDGFSQDCSDLKGRALVHGNSDLQFGSIGQLPKQLHGGQRTKGSDDTSITGGDLDFETRQKICGSSTLQHFRVDPEELPKCTRETHFSKSPRWAHIGFLMSIDEGFTPPRWLRSVGGGWELKC